MKRETELSLHHKVFVYASSNAFAFATVNQAFPTLEVFEFSS